MTLLRTLMVEDNEDDSILVQEVLRNGGYDLNVLRVETEEDLRQALHARPWDIVLSDYMLPSFDARGALGVAYPPARTTTGGDVRHRPDSGMGQADTRPASRRRGGLSS